MSPGECLTIGHDYGGGLGFHGLLIPIYAGLECRHKHASDLYTRARCLVLAREVYDFGELPLSRAGRNIVRSVRTELKHRLTEEIWLESIYTPEDL